MKLETEFEIFKYLYMFNKMVDYYRTIEQFEINLSGAFYESPETRAKKALSLRGYNAPSF